MLETLGHNTMGSDPMHQNQAGGVWGRAVVKLGVCRNGMSRNVVVAACPGALLRDVDGQRITGVVELHGKTYLLERLVVMTTIDGNALLLLLGSAALVSLLLSPIRDFPTVYCFQIACSFSLTDHDRCCSLLL